MLLFFNTKFRWCRKLASTPVVHCSLMFVCMFEMEKIIVFLEVYFGLINTLNPECHGGPQV